MKTSTPNQAPSFASAAPTSAADELVDRLLAFHPIDTTVVETAYGDSEATRARVVAINPDGTATDLEERLIFWTVVRRQLNRATPESPWIAGRLVQSGQAYVLEAITATDAPLVASALASLSD